MPADIADALSAHGLRDAYDARPPYQRNDWLIWIKAAKRPQTRAKRLALMLSELAAGHGYMGMAWHPAGAGKQG
ncbi:MAG: YdeI/OmpD-associated family protein [Rhodobacteraceae bacterium]|nr:YdeI/OmpD-associated family protein [Paracoccaceae bacterium]